MTRGKVRRLGAAGVVLGCLIALPGPAGADDAQKLSIVGPATIAEGGTATYTIRLTDGADDTATVKVDAAPAGSTSASDISFTPATLTVPEGATGVSFAVQATQDGADELDEPFTVTLSDAQRATIETASVTTNIIDDDTPALSVSNAAAVDEGDQATFTVSSGPSGSESR